MGLFGRKKNKIDEIFEQDKKNQEGERTTENLKAEAETDAVAGSEVAGDKAALPRQAIRLVPRQDSRK